MSWRYAIVASIPSLVLVVVVSLLNIAWCSLGGGGGSASLGLILFKGIYELQQCPEPQDPNCIQVVYPYNFHKG